jgi:proline iminopeptidase
MTVHGAARERFLRFRRAQPRAPKLARVTVHARGLDFAVYTTPAVPGVTPLLCVNGGLHFGHDVLWPALSPLSLRRRLVFFDQRGRGQSQAPPGPRSARVEHDASDIPAIREALEIERWDLLGHSWGGGIAMLATAMDQPAVRRLVLVDSVGPDSDWLSALHPRAVERLSGDRKTALAALDPESLHADDVAAHAAYTSALYPAWFADKDFASIFAAPRADSPTGAAVAARLRREGYDWLEAIESITVPTLVVHGEDDLLPVAVAHRIASLIRGAQLAVIPHAGHMPFWEAPEEFFGTVERFLNSGT